jgi:hypothetical protein
MSEPLTVSIKSISVTYGRKINLGDYNSAELSITVHADVPDLTLAEDARKELQEFARESVREEYVELMKSRKLRNGAN